MRRWRLKLPAALGLALAIAGAGRAAVLVNGAGATFPYPIYSKWFDEFHKRNPEVQINYQSIGSGGGIRQVTDGTVDFGASDGPMTDEQLAATKVPILHLPTVLGAVVPTFNLKGIESLRFTPEIMAGIFLGKITRWDDSAIAEANPGVTLPAEAIVPVHRSDGSGTTYVFTDYLTKVSPEWARSVGKGTAVNWPVGLGGKGNEGVTGLVKQTPNALGYVELVYAVQNKLPVGAVKNRGGRFVAASLDSITAAAASAASNMPPDFRVSITDAGAAEAYPIASFTWLLVPTRIKDADKGRAMKEFLTWMLADGQKLAPALQYAPLPEAVIGLERQALERISVGAT
ncbi:MAG: phosphate ABC transporter substrate-binding protein PstS [Deltaproteobacteria bacterium]|nr:MAG: phosphate ABC transporter substrate-binding protein PstS [Deltaproteobacteria bacterium]